MNSRQQTILKTVIEEYVNLAEPVGSRFLSQKYDWGISAATIRNDLAKLVEEGYLEQPHTSAGRIPTDKGYRFFIQSLKEDISNEKRFSKIINSIFESVNDEHRLFKEITRTLAELSDNMSIAGLLMEDEIFKAGISRLLRQPEFDEINEFWRFADDFEKLDQKIFEYGPEICETRKVQVFIGRENPLVENKELSLVISGYEKKRWSERRGWYLRSEKNEI